MSNVLIGIIGVILFIGLALAGALLLGDDFLTANSSSRAAAITSTLQQSANAVNMYELKTGQTVYARSSTQYGDFLVPRFLKQRPSNPHTRGPVIIIDAAGGGGTGNRAAMWYTNIGTDSTARDICRAIEEGAGATNPDAALSVANVNAAGGWTGWHAANRRIGCMAHPNTSPTVYQAYIWF